MGPSHSRRVFIHGDHEGSGVPFTLAFNLAAKATKNGESPLVICRKRKCSAGNLPPIVTETMNREQLTKYREDGSVTKEKWDLNALSKIEVQHVETLEELVTFLGAVHKWKKKMPTLIVIDDLASYLSESNRTYQDMLCLVTFIQNALVSLNDEFQDEASHAMKMKRLFKDGVEVEEEESKDKSSEKPMDLNGNMSAISSVNFPNVLLRNRLKGIEIGLVLSETSQHSQVCDHVVEKLRLEMALEVSSPRSSTQAFTDSKVTLSFSHTPYLAKNRKRSRGDSEIGVHPPFFLERERDHPYPAVYSNCSGAAVTGN